MSAAVTFWRAEHASFTHLLDLLERKLAAFRTEEPPDYELMLDIVNYLRHFPDRYHHAREDVAFACLKKRAPGIAPLVEQLRTEHRKLAAAGEALEFLLSGALEGAIVPRKSIEASAEDYLVLYRQHIANEDTNILPRALALLTPEDWAKVALAVPQGTDPLFGAEADTRYLELRRQIQLEAR